MCITKQEMVDKAKVLRDEWNKVLSINRGLKWASVDKQLRDLINALQNY